ncbi:MAG: aminopeptidase P family protein [Alphaproteobacteria bacterium]|nr:aminopeptidase P family protein [Alphaproteobacteria bacterium]
MNIQEIRTFLTEHHLQAYVVTHGNRFIGQDIIDGENKLKQLCGFSGSAGIMAVTPDKVYLLVDGRYELQARLETDSQVVTVVDAMPRFKNICDVLKTDGIDRVAYDAWNHTVAEMEFIKRRYPEISFSDVGDLLHTDTAHAVKVQSRDVAFAGVDCKQKINTVAEIIREKSCDYYLLTSADSVSWLLNIYAAELSYSPVVRAYALIDAAGKAILIGDGLEASSFEVWSWQQFTDFWKQRAGVKILYDAHATPEKIKLLANKELTVIKCPDMCQMMKAEKNAVELKGMIDCHIRDGVALTKLLYWLENNWRGATELSVVHQLHQLRAEQHHFFSESFATIAGAGAHGAVVHYQPDEKSDVPLEANNLLLLDSGGQYLDGTTDVTRTIVLGTPSRQMIEDFTRVLKAHIRLSSAYFPINTAGIKLDVLARAEIWKNGLDYKHGTGHGVACFGNVHEGPISISVGGSEYGFKPNMVVSVEPGIYREGLYGIRIENLVYTKSVESFADGGQFLQFCNLTKVPIDKRLIDAYLLNEGERAWLNEYHRDVYDSLAPYLNENEKIWLKDACSPLS